MQEKRSAEDMTQAKERNYSKTAEEKTKYHQSIEFDPVTNPKGIFRNKLIVA